MDESHLHHKTSLQKRGVEGKFGIVDNPFFDEKGRHKTLISYFEQIANPMHVYCRAIDLFSHLGKYEFSFQDKNRNRKVASILAINYEKYFYKPIKKLKIDKPLKFVRAHY